jgi:hypothetical protein
MKPIEFPEANKVLIHPPGMTEEECGDLHVHQTDDGKMISCWELSEEELAAINKTKRVWLWVWGATQPPVAIDGANPFEERESNETTEAQDRQGD